MLTGLAVGLISVFLIIFRGTDDYEGKLVVGQNLGTQYRATWGMSLLDSPGVIKRFGVPIWDAAQSLGFRLPTLISQYSQSPIVFLSKIMPVENIAILQFLFTVISSLVLINMMIASLETRGIVARLFFLNVSLLGMVILYTVINDFYFHVDQICSLALIFCALYITNINIVISSLQIILIRASLLIGLSFVLSGHPTWWVMAFVLIVVMMPELKLLYFHLGRGFTLTCFGLAGLLVLPNSLEILAQEWPTGTASYQTQTSIFDFFQDTWVYRYQPFLAFVAAGFQPILRILNEAGSRTEFFNLSALLLLLVLRFKTRTSGMADGQSFAKSLRVVFVLLMMMMFGGLIARSNIGGLSFLFSNHAWQLANPVLIVVSILFCIKYFSISQCLQSKNILISKIGKTILLIPVFLGVMHPIVMIEKGPKNSPYSVFRDQSVNLRSASTISNLGFVYLERQTILKSTSDQEIIYLLDGKISGLRNEVYLSRSGYPSIAAATKGRSVLTLNSPIFKFQSSSATTIDDCDPEVFDFLSVSTIVVGDTPDDRDLDCVKKLKDYFGSESKVLPVQNKFEKLSFVVQPNSFRSFTISTDLISRSTEPCPILEQDCLTALGTTALAIEKGTPFKLCEDDCIFRYKWETQDDSELLILPANFDKALVVRDLLTGNQLKSNNYQGLIAVSLDGLGNTGEVEVSLKPDFLMWVRVFTTYFHLIVLVATFGLLFKSGFVATRKILSEI